MSAKTKKLILNIAIIICGILMMPINVNTDTSVSASSIIMSNYKVMLDTQTSDDNVYAGVTAAIYTSVMSEENPTYVVAASYVNTNTAPTMKDSPQIIDISDLKVNDISENNKINSDTTIKEISENETEPEEVVDTNLEKIFPDIPLSAKIQNDIQTLADKYNVPIKLMMSIAYCESSYDPSAIGKDGHDKGLFQVRDTNLKWLEDEIGRDLDLMNYYDNTEAACFILSWNRKNNPTASWQYILLCYNRGPSGAKSYVNEYGTSSSDYTKKVLSKAYALGFK